MDEIVETEMVTLDRDGGCDSGQQECISTTWNALMRNGASMLALAASFRTQHKEQYLSTQSLGVETAEGKPRIRGRNDR